MGVEVPMAVRLCGGHGPLWYRMTGTPPGLAAAVAGAAVRRLRSAVPSAPVFQVASPSPHFSFSGSSGRGIQYRGGALCSRALAWDSGRREGGGSGSQHAGPGWGGGLLFFASESAAAGFGHRVAWSRRGVAARA